jgi:hypothetical protein
MAEFRDAGQLDHSRPDRGSAMALRAAMETIVQSARQIAGCALSGRSLRALAMLRGGTIRSCGALRFDIAFLHRSI